MTTHLPNQALQVIHRGQQLHHRRMGEQEPQHPLLQLRHARLLQQLLRRCCHLLGPWGAAPRGEHAKSQAQEALLGGGVRLAGQHEAGQ
jgi:hypothetical protein